MLPAVLHPGWDIPEIPPDEEIVAMHALGETSYWFSDAGWVFAQSDGYAAASGALRCVRPYQSALGSKASTHGWSADQLSRYSHS